MKEDDNPDVLFDQLSNKKPVQAAGIETLLMNSKKVWYSTIVHCLIAHQVRQTKRSKSQKLSVTSIIERDILQETIPRSKQVM
jgi:hypothetical protein